VQHAVHRGHKLVNAKQPGRVAVEGAEEVRSLAPAQCVVLAGSTARHAGSTQRHVCSTPQRASGLAPADGASCVCGAPRRAPGWASAAFPPAPL
jgi:hypothetical protein